MAENSLNNQKQVKVGVGVIVIKNGKTLLSKRMGGHSKGAWGSAGGHLEYGETPIQGVKREAKEELGIELSNLKLISVINWLKEDAHYVDITFSADIASGEPKILEPDKISEFGWFDLDNLPKPLFDFVRVPLEAITTGKIYHEITE